MLGIVDPKDGSIRISRIVIFDALIVSLFTSLILLHVISPFPAAVIGYPIIFVANVVFILKAYKRHRTAARKSDIAAVPKGLWFAASVCTISSIVLIAAWVSDRDIRSAIQAIGALLLAGYAWFLVHRANKREKLERGERDPAPAAQGQEDGV